MGERKVSAAQQPRDLAIREAATPPRMDACELDDSRAPVAFGRRAVPQLFEELRQPGADRRRRALASLCDLLHHQELIYQAVTGGYLEKTKVLFRDKDPSVRIKTCELLFIVTAHSFGRQALLASSLLPPLAKLLDDSSTSCRRNVHRVLNHLSLLPAGARALLSLVPKLMVKLQEEKDEEEEVQVLLLSTLCSCSRLDPVPALAADGISLLGRKLSHPSPSVRREAAAAMMALSVCEDGKWRVCEGAVLPVLLNLLQDNDVEVQANAVGVVMYTVILTRGKQLCLELGFIPVLLQLLVRKSEEDEERRRRRKALSLYTLRTLTSLGEAPVGRHILLYQLSLLRERSGAQEEDPDIRQAALTAIRVITRVP